MTQFRLQDTDSAWHEFVEWLMSMSLFEYNNAKVSYYQDTHQSWSPAPGGFKRIFVITIGDESTAALFKLRFNTNLLPN
jgi:hypothetical protein